eukprot:jgi/Botrbrau1/12431/Bobra.0229s0027.1
MGSIWASLPDVRPGSCFAQQKACNASLISPFPFLGTLSGAQLRGGLVLKKAQGKGFLVEVLVHNSYSCNGNMFKLSFSFTKESYSLLHTAMASFLHHVGQTTSLGNFPIQHGRGHSFFGNNVRGNEDDEQTHLKKRLSFKELSQYFHMPIDAASKEMNICPTVLKKICRHHGLPRWPHRKLRSIDRLSNRLKVYLGESKAQECPVTLLCHNVEGWYFFSIGCFIAVVVMLMYVRRLNEKLGDFIYIPFAKGVHVEDGLYCP